MNNKTNTAALSPAQARALSHAARFHFETVSNLDGFGHCRVTLRALARRGLVEIVSVDVRRGPEGGRAVIECNVRITAAGRAAAE